MSLPEVSPSLRQRHINRREIGGMLRDRVRKTFAGHNAGANFVYDWT